MIVGIGLAIFQQVTGINTVIYYTPTILEFSGIKSVAVSILGTTGIGVINVIFTIVGAWLVDWAGRRPLLLISLTGMAASLGLLALAFQLPQFASSLGMAVVVILMLYVLTVASVIFTYKLVPETKDLTLEQIQEEMKTHHVK